MGGGWWVREMVGGMGERDGGGMVGGMGARDGGRDG